MTYALFYLHILHFSRAAAKERGIYQPLLTDSDRNNSNAPEDSASIFSKWFLFYLDPLFSLGVKKELVLEDLGGPSQQVRIVLTSNEIRFTS